MPDVARAPPIRSWTSESTQTNPVNGLGDFRGLGIPNRGNNPRGRAAVAARGSGGVAVGDAPADAVTNPARAACVDMTTSLTPVPA